MRLLMGTSNAGKLREYRILLAELDAELVSPADVGLAGFDVEEPFETFEENAVHKARAYAQASGLIAVVDDSGLEVDALGGRPGVYSARYGGPTDHDRCMKLLGELEAVPEAERRARFVCIAAAVDPRLDLVETSRGTVEGIIATQPGENVSGFGYDPIFIPDGYDHVFSALPIDEKNHISHRGRSVRGLLPALRRLLASP